MHTQAYKYVTAYCICCLGCVPYTASAASWNVLFSVKQMHADRDKRSS
jgi:hypothetical protein